ncbi:hypothetical protein LJC09_02450 [Desulfovibrio sp. OttesenSCG-928-F20]|nr:hypothetical protein [Desulfovibrio sp. OttesenSCG-928-F20]
MNRTFTLKQSLAWLWMALTVLLLGAHFYRAGEYGITACAGGVLLFLCLRSAWKRHAVALFLLWGMLEWLHSAYFLAVMRHHMGLPWLRAVAILSVIAIITGFAAAYANKTASRAAEEREETNAFFQGIVFISIFLILFYLRQVDKLNFLLLERFSPLFGSVQIFFVSWYGAFCAGKLIDPRQSRQTRKIIWIIFGCCFFAQFFLGLLGVDKMLLTGKLHVPVPAFIIYGPIFRSSFSMMPVIVLVSTILVSAAWCSMLCYFGPFEAFLIKRKPVQPLPAFLQWALKYGRLTVLISGVLITLGLRQIGIELATAVAVSIAYATGSLIIMAFVSRKYGGMLHCTTACPMGLLVNLLGKFSPWRLRVEPDRCDNCGACEKICLYRAITPESRKAGKALLRCSLCRDCVSVCGKQALYIGCPGLSPDISWKVFTGLLMVVHTVFLSVAMV